MVYVYPEHRVRQTWGVKMRTHPETSFQGWVLCFVQWMSLSRASIILLH